MAPARRARSKRQCGRAQSFAFLLAQRLEPDALPVIIKEFDAGLFEGDAQRIDGALLQFLSRLKPSNGAGRYR